MKRTPVGAARGRLVRTAYDLFARRGVNNVGIDEIIKEAGVAKTTLYHHFRSKDDLVLAVIALREELWSRDWLEREAVHRGDNPQARLLAIFDLFDEWFHRPDYEGCLFINTLTETHDRSSGAGAAAVDGIAGIHAFIRALLEEAGVKDPDRLADQTQLLMRGAIIAALEGHLDSAQRAREAFDILLRAELGSTVPASA